MPPYGRFIAREHIEGRDFDIELHWIPLEKVEGTEVYPSNASEMLEHINESVKHFVYRGN